MPQHMQVQKPQFARQPKRKRNLADDSVSSPQNDLSAIHRMLEQQSISQLSHTEIATLQRTIGNQQVLNLVRQQTALESGNGDRIARAPDPVSSGGLLTPPQVQAAIAYHTNQPWRYTRNIIMDIQFEVGTVPTGRMTEIDVQAVAKRQQAMNDAGEKPLLKVDGMAGPRTLPSIFKIGLAQEDSITEYTGKAKEILASQGGKSDEEVALELCAEVNKSMVAQKMPPLNVDTKELVGGRGVFRASEWKLLLDPRQFNEAKLKNLNKTTSTVYHEARHAEQAYRIAQMLAGKGYNAKQIEAKTGLMEDVAKIAAQKENHLQPGTMEAVIAEGWYDSLHGDAGKAKIIKNNAEMDKAFAEKKAAEEAFEANPTPENQLKLDEAKAAYQKTLDEHDDLPHEFDAERLEDKVEKQLGD